MLFCAILYGRFCRFFIKHFLFLDSFVIDIEVLCYLPSSSYLYRLSVYAALLQNLPQISREFLQRFYSRPSFHGDDADDVTKMGILLYR